MTDRSDRSDSSGINPIGEKLTVTHFLTRTVDIEEDLLQPIGLESNDLFVCAI